MARIVVTCVLIVLLNVLVGCQAPDSGRGTMVARSPGQRAAPLSIISTDASEADMVEDMATNREGYRKALELLAGYYMKVGNNMKYEWAQKELASFDAMPKYRYIIGPEMVGTNLKPTASISQADDLFYDAQDLEKRAGTLFKNEDMLRMALAKYDELITKYPTSDKIDDAAYYAGVLYEDFKDYTIALTYYQRAYQWDPDTIYPARFRAGRILDKNLHRNAEALKLYQEAVRTEGRFDKYREWKEFAERRIAELQKIEQN